MNKIYVLFSFFLFTKSVFPANITVIQGTFGAEAIWNTVGTSMGHTVTIQPETILDNTAFFSTTDVLVTPDYDIFYTPARNNNIIAFMQTGKSVYLQSEYDLNFNGNQAFQSIVGLLGGSFTWSGTVAGVLAPMNVLGTLGTTPVAIPPLSYFWYGCEATVCNNFDSFLEYGGQYFGFTFCPPGAGTGRLMTTSDQDWILQSTSLDLIQNMIAMLLTPPAACGFTASTISLGNDTTLCSGDHLLLGAGISATSYLWSTGATSAVIIVDTSATYWLQITAGGCTAFDTVDVTFIPCAINASFAAADSFICPGTCTDFIDFSLNAATYQWTFSGGNPGVSSDANPSGICYSSPGSYDVTLIITNGVLTDTLTFSNYITVYPLPPAQGIIQNGDTLIANQGAVSYQWYHNSVLIPGATNYFHIAEASGNFNVVATDNNGCEVEAGIFDVIASVSLNGSVEDHILISPVPADDKISIASKEKFQISIVDVLGKSVYNPSDFSGSQIISTANLADGIYFLLFTGEKFSGSKKFLVIHK